MTKQDKESGLNSIMSWTTPLNIPYMFVLMENQDFNGKNEIIQKDMKEKKHKPSYAKGL